MDKLKGVAFIVWCCLWISYRILVGRKWNLLIVDLEEKTGRQRYNYRITGGKYVLEKDPFLKRNRLED